MICKKCGKKIKEGSKWCPNCGERIETEQKKEKVFLPAVFSVCRGYHNL